MKPHFLLFAAAMLLIEFGIAQTTTLTLQPDASTGKDAITHSRYGNTNYSTHVDFTAIAGSNGSIDVFVRSFIDFDLSSIPTGATVVDARLSLFTHTSPGNGNHSTISGSNETILSRVISPWTETGITWDNQPSTASANIVMLPATTSSLQHFPNIDVTNLVQDMVDDPANSYGFMLKLVNEAKYRKMVFASSDHADTNLHPKLVVTYSLTPPPPSDSCFVLRPDAANGKDAMVHSRYGSTNYGTHYDFAAIAGSNGSIDVFVRSFVDFDLSGVPVNAVIDDARLSLYSYTSPANDHHSTISGPNTTTLSRVTDPWTESGITWDTQPATSSANTVTLQASAFDIQDYLDIDVTSLVQDMINDPANSHGFMLKLVNEAKYRKMVFASSDNANTQLHPKLEICYTDTTSNLTLEAPLLSNSDLTLYPNPASTNLNIYSKGFYGKIEFKIFSASGEELKQGSFLGEHTHAVDISALAPGMYYFRLKTAATFITQRFSVVK
jgi:hypothetical protein